MKKRFLALSLFILLIPAGALAGHTTSGQRCGCETTACLCGPDDPFEEIVLEQQPVKKHSNQAPAAGFEASALAFVLGFLLWLRMR